MGCCGGLPFDPPNPTGTRGAVTIFLFLVWATMILGVKVDHAIVTLQYGAGQYIQHLLTALVFLVIGRMWGIEVDSLVQRHNISANQDDNE